jgi:uncharacterized 2Fe-2S/4Fe-4S cluster protein (DUF4445 family)
MIQPEKTVLFLVADGQQHSIEPQGKEVEEPLTALLRKRGFSLNTRCGEHGLCRGCECLLHSGAVIHGGQRLEATKEPTLFRSCQARLVQGREATIEIPDRSLLHHKPDVAGDFKVRVPVGKNPHFPGPTPYTAAVDIGTTTIMVALTHSESGELLARAGDFNAQIHFGDNVLTRIQACGDNPAHIAAQQKAVVQGNLIPLLRKCCDQAGVEPGEISGIALTGNTTMLHLLTGTDPSPLGFAPFKAAFLEPKKLTIGDLSSDSGGFS